MARIRINTRNHTKEKPKLIKFVFFFFAIGKAKKSVGWAKEWDTCWRNFCNFPLLTEKCERETKTSSGPIPHPLSVTLKIIQTKIIFAFVNTPSILFRDTNKNFRSKREYNWKYISLRKIFNIGGGGVEVTTSEVSRPSACARRSRRSRGGWLPGGGCKGAAPLTKDFFIWWVKYA